MKKLYVIAGPNGAGKTTLSYTILPEIFECDEFINADEIARGISPLNPEKAAIRAGRLMIERLNELIVNKESFAFETTLSSRAYRQLINRAKSLGYDVTLLFLCLESVELAIERVKTRVLEGGHDIPTEVIKRRYLNGITNFFTIYQPLANNWVVVDNSSDKFEFIAQSNNGKLNVSNKKKWSDLNEKYGI
ncbi:MAG: zeta toxin family protein [Cyclobacteriaceae bacterium]